MSAITSGPEDQAAKAITARAGRHGRARGAQQQGVVQPVRKGAASARRTSASSGSGGHPCARIGTALDALIATTSRLPCVLQSRFVARAEQFRGDLLCDLLRARPTPEKRRCEGPGPSTLIRTKERRWSN
jgi:hypothetical protein